MTSYKIAKILLFFQFSLILILGEFSVQGLSDPLLQAQGHDNGEDIEPDETTAETQLPPEGGKAASDYSTVYIVTALFALTNLIKGVPAIIGGILMRKEERLMLHKNVDFDVLSDSALPEEFVSTIGTETANVNSKTD